jgi:predicted DNA-binding transcriptional regulator AlpA
VQVGVELPPGPLVEYLTFCHAIVEAACPTSEQHYRGIECIVGKMLKHHGWMGPPGEDEKWPVPVEFQAVLVSEGGHTFDQLLPDQSDPGQMNALELPLEPGLPRQMVELPMPYRLNEDDRRALRDILPNLPLLRYPISDADQAAFLDAWIRLKERPAWEPILVTAAYIERRKLAKPSVLADQQWALQHAFESGRLEALDAYHIPVAVLAAGSFIPRQQAIAYLERRSFSYVDRGSAMGAEHDSRPAAPEAERKQDSTRVAIRTRAQETSPPAIPRVEAPNGKRKENNPVESTGAGERNAASLSAAGDGNATVGKIARLPRVEELTGLKRSSIYNRMDGRSKHYDPTFPRAFSLGAEGGAVGWNEEQVKAWVAAQARAGRT